MNEITINTSRPYKVLSEKGVLAKSGNLIRKALFQDSICRQQGCAEARKLCLLCDSSVHNYYGEINQPLYNALHDAGFDVREFIFPPGENSKTFAVLEHLISFLADNQFTRSDIIATLGGGVAGDLGGFAASIYMRGISYVQIPTTLLAAADSSAGGKTAVNISKGKNLAGTFWQPSLVLFDPDTLETLPDIEILNGLAEIIKAGIIGDPKILTLVSEAGSLPSGTPSQQKSLQDILADAAMRAVKVKADIVSADERESGKRKLLNLGHTAAHAIEKLSRYSIPHGIAVMTGMYITSLAACEYGWSSEDTSVYIKKVIDDFTYPVITEFEAADLANTALHDKKRSGDVIYIAYPDCPGHCSMKKIPTSQLESFFSCGLVKARKTYGNINFTAKA